MLFLSVYMIYTITVCASKSSEAKAEASHCSKFFLSDVFFLLLDFWQIDWITLIWSSLENCPL